MNSAFAANPSIQMGTYYPPAAPALPEQQAPVVLSPQEAYEGVQMLAKMVPAEQRAIFLESAATRLADDLGMSDFGRQFTDRIQPNRAGRKSFEMNPWNHTGAGATCVVTATDRASGEIYVLIARKYKDAEHPELGYADDLILPGGYITAKPLENADAQQFDFNLAATAKRELEEETGLDLQGVKPISLGADSRAGYSNDPRLHTVNEFFHFPLQLQNGAASLPPVSGRDDIAIAGWVKASDIGIRNDLPPQPFGSKLSRFQVNTAQGPINLRDEHGEYLLKAIRQIEQQQSQPQQKNWQIRIRVNPTNNPLER